MPRSQADTTAAALLGTWTDSDTAMQIVGTSLGLFGPGSLKPERALSRETPLRNALFDVLLSLVEGGAIDMRPTDDGLYAFRWRSDYAVAGLTSEMSASIDIDPPSPYLSELVQLRRERDDALARARSAEARALEGTVPSPPAPETPAPVAKARVAPKSREKVSHAITVVPDEIDIRDDAELDTGALDTQAVEEQAIEGRAADIPAPVSEDRKLVVAPAPRATRTRARRKATVEPEVAEPEVAEPEVAVAPAAVVEAEVAAEPEVAPEPEVVVAPKPAKARAPKAAKAKPAEAAEVADPPAAVKPAKTPRARKAKPAAPVAEPTTNGHGAEPIADEPIGIEPDRSDVVYLTQPVAPPAPETSDAAEAEEVEVVAVKPRRAKWSGYTLDKPRGHLSSVERLAEGG
jgi:hypothetical protein